MSSLRKAISSKLRFRKMRELSLTRDPYWEGLSWQSNDRTLDGELMLQYYRGQNAVEKGFRYILDCGVDAQEKIGGNRRSGVKSPWKTHAKTYFKVDIPKIQKYKSNHYRIKGDCPSRRY
jgi:hypothetical protein